MSEKVQLTERVDLVNLKRSRDNSSRHLGTCISTGLSDTCLSVTSILLTQRKLRVVGAIRQDKNINAISMAIGIGIRSVIADIVIALVGAQVA